MEKRDLMFDAVMLSLKGSMTMAAEKYDVSRQTLAKWKKKFIEEGRIEDGLEVVNGEEYSPNTPRMIIEPTQEVFARELEDVKLIALRRMKGLIEKETDLDKVSKAFKSLNDFVNLWRDKNMTNKPRMGIFDAAKVMEDNMKEILTKQNKALR